MIGDTCPVCGLPKELCVCSKVEKTSTEINIRVERRRYGKLWAVLSGIDVDSSDLKDIMKKLKNKLACGGTVKGKEIEILYGKHDRTEDLINVLEGLGFDRDSIYVSRK